MTPTAPEVGQTVIVHLPDEITRGIVEEVLKPDEIVVTIDQVIVSKVSEYRQGSQLHARRSADPLAGFWWTAVRKLA